MRRVLNNIISVGHSCVRFSLLKIVCGSRLSVKGIQRFSPDVVVEVKRGAILKIGNKVRVHSGTKIKVRKNGELLIGEGTKINYNCIFVCRNKIEIGAGTEFGPSVYIYDHDHNYRAGLKEDKFLESPIIIGKNCWIGANTVILRGTVLGDNCVVGAGSVLRGKYPNGSIIIQKRETKVTTY